MLRITMSRAFLVTGALIGITGFAAIASADIVYFDVVGDATGSGTLVIEVRAVAAGCTGALIASYTQAYDAVPGGPTPTRADELAAAIAQGLDAALPSGYVVGFGKKNQPPPEHIAHCFISSSSALDICVEGEEIVSNNRIGSTHSENGVRLRWQALVPALDGRGMAFLMLLLAASSVLVLRRYRLAGTAPIR